MTSESVAPNAEQSALYGDWYGSAPVRAIFSVRERLRAMLTFEVALARAQAATGVIPRAAAEAIAAAADAGRLDVDAIVAGTQTTGFPVVALVAQLARLAGDDAGRYVHWGATTQDVLDTATVLQLRAALPSLGGDLDRTIAALAARAARHRDDLIAGRTHLQHALPVTFGYVCAIWLAPLLDARERLRAARERALRLQFGGAAGTSASLGPRAREVAQRLGAELDLPVPEAPWHADRSAFAELACALALTCGSYAKMATDVALLAQTEVAEVAEPHLPGRGGSSAMPQKRNPVASEYVLACTRAVHALSGEMLAAMAGDHQRSTGPYQSEENTLWRVVVHASGAFAHGRSLAEGILVDAQRMRANVDLTGGRIVSEAVAVALAAHVGSGDAHAAVERAASTALEEKRPLLDVLAADPAVTAYFDRDALAELLDPERYTGEAGAVVDRVLARAARCPSTAKEKERP